MANKKVTTIEELEGLMKGKSTALKSVFPIGGPEHFTLITRRNTPNRSVEPKVAEEFIEKYEDKMKKIALNTASTDLYVLI